MKVFFNTEDAESTEQKRLVQVGDFSVEVGQGGFQGSFVIGICGAVEVVRDADAG